ncbi:MAG: DUF898 family protein [Candidatus Sericytochromatia bacterium]|nr:DUF898 family protein [Candidatus Sericytochromatia bacterium]
MTDSPRKRRAKSGDDSVPAGKKRKKAVARFEFHGTGGTLLKLWVINSCLTFVTLGVYRFWARAQMRQYLYGQLSFRKERFTFHGTGKESFLGMVRLIGLGVLALLGFGAVIGGLAWNLIPEPWSAMLDPSMLALLVGGVASPLVATLLLPFALVSARRYVLSRTAYQGIRFSYRGVIWRAILRLSPFALLTVLSLGLLWPYFYARLQNELTNHTYYGNAPFQCQLEGKNLIVSWVLGLLAAPFSLGISLVWTAATWTRARAEATRFGKARFRSDVTFVGLFRVWLINMVLATLTVGLAMPWNIVRSWRYQASCLRLVGPLNLAAIRQEALEASASGDALLESMDVELDFGA